MKFNRILLIRSRDIDISVLTGNVIFKTGSGHSNSQKYTFLELDDHADHKNLFRSEIGVKLRNLAKICTFCKFLVRHFEYLMSCDFLHKL